MKINFSPNIFRAYDIRGIYPKEINETTAYFLGRAFVRFLRQKNRKKPKIIVGQDNRFSSKKLWHGLIQGILEEGGEVVDIGLSTSPMFYWASGYYQFMGGVYITASHNPPQYNGFKLVIQGTQPLSSEFGLPEIKKLFLDLQKEAKLNFKKKVHLTRKKVLNQYLNFVLEHSNFSPKTKFFQKPVLKIVIDTANAVSGTLIKPLFKKINQISPIKFQIYHLFPQLNGLFPNHLPDPLKEENLKTLCSTVKTKKAHLGVAFDGDGDRIVLIDEKGRKISGDLLTALIAQIILREKKNKKILYDIRSSNSVKEAIKEAGGQPVVWKIGHSLIKAKMRKDKIIFGGEFSGHYYHQDYYFAECPLFVLVKILESLVDSYPKPFSNIIQPLQRYYHSGEINFPIKEINTSIVKEKLFKKLIQKYASGKVYQLDGLRIDFPQWWFLVRPSNTEPLIRLIVEAKKPDLMRKKVQELKSIIKKF